MVLPVSKNFTPNMKYLTKKFNFVFPDAPKNVKRSRVPKGFLSSNTAYMLVYKRVNDSTRVNISKRSKLKRAESETNSVQPMESSSNHCVDQTETLTDDKKMKKDKMDEEKADADSKMQDINDAIKLQHMSVKSESNSSQENINQELVSDMNRDKLNETAHSVVDNSKITDENKYKTNDLNHTQSNKNPKFDYKKLNGAAHRAMSCGQRDFYEEVIGFVGEMKFIIFV